MIKIKDFIRFLKKPTYQVQQDKISITQTFKILFYWFLISYFIYFVMIFFRISLYFLTLLPQQSDLTRKVPLSFYVLIFIPLCEELIFRISLRYSKLNLSITFASIIFLASHKIIDLNYLNSAIVSIVSFLLCYFFLFKKLNEQKLNHFWEKNIVIFFYFSSLLFGILHLTNFVDLKFIHFLLFPVLVGDQIIGGLILGYLRLSLKNGIIYSILLHILIDLPILLIKLN